AHEASWALPDLLPTERAELAMCSDGHGPLRVMGRAWRCRRSGYGGLAAARRGTPRIVPGSPVLIHGKLPPAFKKGSCPSACVAEESADVGGELGVVLEQE